MKRRSVLSLLGLAAVGCGTTNLSLPDSAVGPRVVRIAVIAPLNAGLVEFGRGIRNSVQLAINQANANNPIAGVRLELSAQDDSSNPDIGAAAAQALLGDPLVIGVVGTYNSGVAAKVIPILAPTQVAMISPANTDPTLTQGNNPAAPARPFSNYFRVVVPDSIQGPELARYTFNVLGIRQVGVVTESKSVSRGLADAFQTTFLGLGGTITTFEVVPAGTTDYSAILTRVAATRPQLLFYGGEFQGAAIVRRQAATVGLSVPLMGGDGVKDPAYVTSVGVLSEGDYASSVGAPASSLPSAANFLKDYAAAGFAEPPSDFGPYAFDATNLLIEAARARLAQGALIDTAFRTQLVADVQATQRAGITGPLSFDAFGDTRNKVITIYRVTGGVFQPLATVTAP